MGMRAALEKWFDAHDLRQRPVGEFEDSALMEVAASGALGFTAVHSVVATAALKHYGLKIIAELHGRTIGAYYARFGTIAAGILASRHPIS